MYKSNIFSKKKVKIRETGIGWGGMGGMDGR
jgi:hypothetical protein